MADRRTNRKTVRKMISRCFNGIPCLIISQNKTRIQILAWNKPPKRKISLYGHKTCPMDQNLNNLVFVHVVLYCFPRAIKADTQQLEGIHTTFRHPSAMKTCRWIKRRFGKLMQWPACFFNGRCTTMDCYWNLKLNLNKLNWSCIIIIVKRSSLRHNSSHSGKFIHWR